MLLIFHLKLQTFLSIFGFILEGIKFLPTKLLLSTITQAATVIPLKRFRTGLSVHKSNQLSNFTPDSCSQKQCQAAATFLLGQVPLHSMWLHATLLPEEKFKGTRSISPWLHIRPRNHVLLRKLITGSVFFSTRQVTISRQHTGHQNSMGTLVRQKVQVPTRILKTISTSSINNLGELQLLSC